MRRFLLALVVPLLLAGAAAPANAAPSEADGRAAIAAILAQEEAAWARGDATAFAAVARSDVVFTNIIGMFSVGRAPFEAQHARIFATIYKGSTMRQTLANLVFVRPDVAIVDTQTRVTGFAALPPGMTAIDGALQTRLEQVMVREGGAWRVASFHNVTIAPAADTPPAR